MARRKRRDDSRRARRADPAGHEAGSQQTGDTGDGRSTDPVGADDEIAARLDAVSSRFTHPPSPEELRAAFGRKPVNQQPAENRQDFASSFPTESLFVPTIDEPIELPTEAEDRSRSRGDYYYDPDDAWGVLGVAPGASWHEIAGAHRRLAKQHHPDRLLSASEEDRAASEAAMRDINVAYSVLRRLTGN